MRWRIYYSDGTTYSSEEGAWEESPGMDVQVVLFQDPVDGWTMRHGGDFFRLTAGGVAVGMDLVGMIDYVVNMLGVVKQGRMLTQREFDRVYQQAKRDMAELKARG